MDIALHIQTLTIFEYSRLKYFQLVFWLYVQLLRAFRLNTPPFSVRAAMQLKSVSVKLAKPASCCKGHHMGAKPYGQKDKANI